TPQLAGAAVLSRLEIGGDQESGKVLAVRGGVQGGLQVGDSRLRPTDRVVVFGQSADQLSALPGDGQAGIGYDLSGCTSPLVHSLFQILEPDQKLLTLGLVEERLNLAGELRGDQGGLPARALAQVTQLAKVRVDLGKVEPNVAAI